VRLDSLTLIAKMEEASIPRGKAVYKKKDGIVTLSDDRASLIWTPLPGTGPPVVSLAVGNIAKVQQTPETTPKVMLKVFERPRTQGGDSTSYLFHFTSPGEDARTEANAVKELLSRLLAEARGDDPGLPKPANPEQAGANGAGGGASAAMSFASAVNSKPSALRWFDDSMLKADIELQESLLRKDEVLEGVYNDARESKPNSISDAAFKAQFWSTRLNLLRAHAIELNQKKGAYNVLSAVKPRTENGELKLSISVEQVQMIFQQHPLVKRIYNENVPRPLSEGEFWSRFFLSRLSKKLRGERVTDNDNTDALFDKYNEADNMLGFSSKITAQQVPHVIDIEGNEENQGGFKGGNRKDVEMRQRANIPIVKTLNSLSEKIMANVAPSDHDPNGPAPADGQGVEEMSELALRDLRGDVEANRIRLSVKEQTKFFSNQSGADDDGQSEEARILEQQTPEDVLFEVQADLETLEDDGAGGLDLHRGIGIEEDSDSDGDHKPNEGQDGKHLHVGSRAARRQAQDQILEGLRRKRAEVYGGEKQLLDDDESPMGIPPDIAQRCYVTNATTTEFLKQFWTLFLQSGDGATAAATAKELAYHAESLRRSGERIDALAAEAERVRTALNDRRKAELKELYKKTGRKTKWVPVGGGRDAVLALFEATLSSLKNAQNLYSAAVGR
jgi:transcription initiation factor TFIIH subunit 1